MVAGVLGATTAEEAWNKLTGAKNLKRPHGIFKYVKNDPKLPNVLIYGDSISMGYTPYVRKSLDGKANVYRIYRNGGASKDVIPFITRLEKTMRDPKLTDSWKFKWNVITVNVGMHDHKYMNGRKMSLTEGKLQATPEVYKANLIKIFNFLIRTQPQARIIYVLTTPVPANSAGRKQGDALKYNDIAKEVLKKYPEIKVCDLYAFTLPNQPKWWSRPGNVHYKPVGQKAQAKVVTEAIETALKKK
jgi:hypothetical protein